MTNLKEKYIKEIAPGLKKSLGYMNIYQIPRIEKIVVSSGIGKILKDAEQVKEVRASLEKITGQKAVLTKARVSIAGFKVRKGLEIGIKITLRGRRMWDFLEKLSQVAIPRTRDFRGIKNSAVDGNGNLNLGIKEHIIFPEILPEQVRNIFGFQVTIVVPGKKRKESLELFRSLGFPIIMSPNEEKKSEVSSH